MPPADEPCDRGHLFELVSECLSRVDEAGPGAVDEFCAAHPDVAAAIRERLSILAGLGLIDGRPVVADSVPSRLGGFRLIRPLASGGMGAIYVAYQESMKREVALKVIRPDCLYFPGAAERFQREVEAVARMQHPSIVPVHTVGEENGLPYLAMELVLGGSLAEGIARLHAREVTTLRGADLREIMLALARERGADVAMTTGVSPVFHGSHSDACLQVMRQVLSGVEHAHRRGVLHRDLKPSNVMLTPDGRALLVDFGLAASSSRADSITASGALVGSVPYMAPEQLGAYGGRADERTDVYAAGVTLYELLTLQSPFQAETVTATQQRILEGTPPSPRRLNRAVPRDLEVVCLKAMSVDPAERYVSAAAFARDLENVLAHRPIDARPISTWTRSRRWSQRHKGGTVAIALGALLILGVPLAYFEQQRRSLVVVRATLRRADAERARAESNLAHALATVGRILESVSLQRVLADPALAGLRLEQLSHAIGMYEQLAPVNVENPQVLAEFASGLRRVGSQLILCGRFEEAVSCLDRARSACRELVIRHPHDGEALLDLVVTGNDMVAALTGSHRDEDAISCAHDVLQEIDAALARTPELDREARDGSVELRLAAAKVHNNLAFACLRCDRAADAHDATETARSDLERLLVETSSAGAVERVLLETLATAAAAAQRLGATPDPIRGAARVDLARRHLERAPDDVYRQRLLLIALVGLAGSAAPGSDAALAAAVEARTLSEHLLERSVDPVLARIDAAAALLVLTANLSGRSEHEATLPVIRRALELLESVPPGRSGSMSLLGAVANAIMVLSPLPFPPELRREYADRALAIADAELAAQPMSVDLRRAREQTAAARANVLVMIREPADATAACLDLLQQAADPLGWLVRIGRTLAVIAALDVEDLRLSPSERTARSQEHLAQALQHLSRAYAAGLITEEELLQDSLLGEVRALPGFTEMIRGQRE